MPAAPSLDHMFLLRLRVEAGLLLEPIVTDLDIWFAELDRFGDVPFMEDGRHQPPMPEPAAQAVRSGATLVTANVSEFARVPGLTFQDWTTTA